jgi:lipopolysaccharide transport system ATP-binding protein
VDEVLAVGDVVFQKKCLGKMGEVSQEGRTILFVSHNMAAITGLCQRAILLNNGYLEIDRTSTEAVIKYLSSNTDECNIKIHGLKKTEIPPQVERGITVTNIEALDEQGRPKKHVFTWDYVRFRIHFKSTITSPQVGIDFGFNTPAHGNIFWYSSDPLHGLEFPLSPGNYQIDCVFTDFPLCSGHYDVQVSISRPYIESYYANKKFCVLYVQPRDVFGAGCSLNQQKALVLVPHFWEKVN